MAFGESVFRIKPGGVIAGEMELDICWEMDGDKGFDENSPVKRRTCSKEDTVIPQTDLKCGEYLFLRDGAECWVLRDKEGYKLGNMYIYLFKTERSARKLLKNSLLSPTLLTLKDVWGRDL